MKIIDTLKSKYNELKDRAETRANYRVQLKLTQALSGLALLNTCLGSDVDQYDNALVFSHRRTGGRCVLDFDNSESFKQQVEDFSEWTTDLFNLQLTRFEKLEYGFDFVLNRDKLNAMLNVFYDQYKNNPLTRDRLVNEKYGFFNKSFNNKEIIFEGDSPQKLTVLSTYRRAGVIFTDLERKGASYLSTTEFNQCVENELLRQAERMFAPEDYLKDWGEYDAIDFSKIRSNHRVNNQDENNRQ